MHALSIAQSIVDTALSEADRHNAKTIREMHIDVGEMMQVDTKDLSNALSLLMTDQRLKGCKLDLQAEVASFSCRKCNSSWGIAEVEEQLASAPDSQLASMSDSEEPPHHFPPSLYLASLNCLKCGGTDVSVNSGEGVRLRKLVLE